MVTLPMERIKKPVMTSWRDLQVALESGASKGWGKFPEISEKKNRFGLGYELSKAALKGKERFPPIQDTFINKGVEHGGQGGNLHNKHFHQRLNMTSISLRD